MLTFVNSVIVLLFLWHMSTSCLYVRLNVHCSEKKELVTVAAFIAMDTVKSKVMALRSWEVCKIKFSKD
jgi:biotin transporter BioY